MRFTLLAVLAAAFCLASVAGASAAENFHIKIVGSGSGKVISKNPQPVDHQIECTWNGETQTAGGSACDAEVAFNASLSAFIGSAEAIADAGSKFVAWTVEVGEPTSAVLCGTHAVCSAKSPLEIKLKAEFEPAGPPKKKLNLSTSGNGSGTFMCKVLPSGSEEACATEYEEGKEVEVIDHPATGSEFKEWTGDCLGSGSCVVTMSTERSVGAVNDLEKRELEIEEPGSGTGAVTVECDGGACPPLNEIDFGTTIKISATADPGSEIGTVSGDHSASGCSSLPCEFALDENSKAIIPFDLELESLTISESGSGTGTVAVECDGGPCPPLTEIPKGATVKVTANPTGGSTLGGVSGSGSAGSCSSSPCEFEITEDSTVSVAFDPPGAAQLAVVKSGNGQGTVASSPAGIDCGPTCSAAFSEGETVVLTETASVPDSIFAGWSANCVPTSATECEVEVASGGSTVTAIFVAVPVITAEPPGANCPEGGIKIEYAGTPQFVCNGEEGDVGPTGPQGNPGNTGPQGNPGDTGPQGNPGDTGPQGNPGATGATGATGAQGATGAKGADGSQGPKGDTGAQGPQGAQGPAGKVKVVCAVKGKKVSCVVKQVKSSKRHGLRHHLRWRLMRGGHVYAHGSTAVRHGHARVQLRTGDLRKGQYVLQVQGQKGATLVIH